MHVKFNYPDLAKVSIPFEPFQFLSLKNHRLQCSLLIFNTTD